MFTASFGYALTDQINYLFSKVIIQPIEIKVNKKGCKNSLFGKPNLN
jgi:hypothetical protein